MSDSYSVKAVLSAVDKGFTSAFTAAQSTANNLKTTLTSGLGFGVMAEIGRKACDVVTNAISEISSGLSESSATWKTYEANMEIFGKSADEIAEVKSELMDFAQKSIYSSSDMASTYSQLAAVGVDSADKLVMAFGGLASAAEDPTQAMKTLSTQATQMAAKPKVAWQDFKLMLEQTPAGIAAVAKQMDMTTSELVAAVQDGTVATEDFFDAVEAVGNSDGFQQQATQFKTVQQAADGLTETITNTLQPAFDLVSQYGIDALSALADKFGEIDGQKLADNISSLVDKIKPYWEVIEEDLGAVKDAFGEAFSAVGDSVSKLNGEFGSTENIDSFSDSVGTVADALVALAGLIEEHADTIAMLIDYLPEIAAGFIAFKAIQAISPMISAFGSALGGILSPVESARTEVQATNTTFLQAGAAFALIGAGVLEIATGFGILAQSAIALSSAGAGAIVVFIAMAAGMAAMMVVMASVLETLTALGPQVIYAGAAMALLGAGVLAVAAGFALMANAAISLANAGDSAITMFALMTTALAGIMVLAAALGPALTAGAVGFVALGAGVTLVGVGALAASAALAVVAAVLPQIVSYGTQGATAITALGASLVVFAAGSVTAAAGTVALGAGLVVAAAGAVTAAAGFVVLLAALTGVSASLKSIKNSSQTAADNLSKMQNSVNAVESGLSGLSSLVDSAMNSIANAFSNAASKATSQGNAIGTNARNALQSSLANMKTIGSNAMSQFNAGLASKAGTITATARNISNRAASAMNSGRSAAYNAGYYISVGFARGMASQLSYIQSVARKMVSAANTAITAKAKIGSPSKITTQYGKWYGVGFGNGISDMAGYVKKQATNLVHIPAANIPSMQLAGTGMNYSLNDNANYVQDTSYTFHITSEVDGRETAKAIVTYTESELSKLTTKNNRRKGML